MRKRILSAILVIAMVFSLTATAFAKEIAPVADKTDQIHKGDEVNVSLSLDEDITAMQNMTVDLTYDNTLFSYKVDETTNDALYESKYETVAATAKDSANKLAIMENKVRVNVFTTAAKGTTIEAGEFVTLTFIAKEDVTESKSAEFKSDVTELMVAGTDITNHASEYSGKTITVTVTPATPDPEPTKGYTVAASAVSTSVIVGNDAQVTLAINNKDAATYNAYYMEVSYDTGVLTYKSINTDASVTDSSGTLKIAGYGSDRTCGIDNIVLTFTGKAVGETKVTVTSAKVDAKANAAEKDALDATITNAEAAITVGGYQVTLPDAFTGAGTANPGEDYTFTAKDTSKDYDFTGSTMGGKTVEVIDNGNGTYTVKNVSGKLVIEATEKVGKVTINLSGDAVDTITQKSWGTATEVDAGTALWFMAQPETGKELVVTVNGEEVTGMNMQAFMRYNIAADKVTGTELNIVVNYKSSTDTITIIETGDAWSDVTLRGTWSADGGPIDMSTAGATYTLKFKPAADKTVDDYVVTINGTTMELKNMRRGEWGVNFVPNEVAVAGKITIDVSYKKAPEPTITVDVSEYVKLNGQSIFLITATGENMADGQVLAYGDNQMYWSAKYNESKGAYAWLVISNKTLEEITTAAAAQVKAVTGTKVEIAYTGDVNLTGNVDINDAQLVWNMYNAEYSDFTTVNVRKFLEADMTADGTLDTSDAVAVTDIVIK